MNTLKAFAATATALTLMSPAYAQDLGGALGGAGGLGSQVGGTVSSTANSATSSASSTASNAVGSVSNQVSQSGLPGSNAVSNRTNAVNSMAQDRLASTKVPNVSVPNLPVGVPTLADAPQIIGQPAVAVDDVVLGTIVDVRPGRNACPIFAIRPNPALGSARKMVLVQSNSCKKGERVIRLSMSSKLFVRSIRN